MKEGRIVEIGTPKEIYFDSDQRFVADFIGRTNLIEGKVKAFEAPYTIVETAIGEIACEKKDGASAGQAAAVSIRPEFIKLATGDSRPGRNVFRGRVESLVFVGDAYEGEIRIGDALLVMKVEPTVGAKESDEVSLIFEPDHCSVLSR